MTLPPRKTRPSQQLPTNVGLPSESPSARLTLYRRLQDKTQAVKNKMLFLRKKTIWLQIGFIVLLALGLRQGLHLLAQLGAKAQIDCPAMATIAGAGPPLGIRQYCVLEGTIRHGPSKGWWPNGSLQSEGIYDRGKKHGVFKRWHHNGTQSSEGTYINGLKQGVWKEWAPQGHLRIQTTYLDGYMHGSRYFYNEAGQITAEFEYAVGIMIEQITLPSPP